MKHITANTCVDCKQTKEMATSQYCKDCLNSYPTAKEVFTTDLVVDGQEVAVTF